MFHELPTITNIYKIDAVKSWKADTDTNAVAGTDDDIEPKKKWLVYETLETWYKCFGYFNTKDILWLAADPASGIAIKGSKMMDFCEAYALAGFK